MKHSRWFTVERAIVDRFYRSKAKHAARRVGFKTFVLIANGIGRSWTANGAESVIIGDGRHYRHRHDEINSGRHRIRALGKYSRIRQRLVIDGNCYTHSIRRLSQQVLITGGAGV